ncbi:hypothetical protein EHN07_05430 [Buttiauxella warmboldiae]|uniref:Uncharacterized protein n=1 Tax=Buttiauxella warmboldiae TaxID=82993 RepID=A0A3N5EB32_9ENTR|nr:hypothetical protein [Buttiauxella warmboldiae]RPH29643.1 hypothetical protein EHN07_05430 [Buttiauxella warmboldiae]
MNAEEDSEHEMDELLAPMVDGLSGALCLLVLVATVFMVSALNKIYKGYIEQQFKGSVVLINEKNIYFWGLISLTEIDLIKINKVPKSVSGKKLVFRIYIDRRTKNYKQVYTSNVIRLNQLIGSGSETISFKEGTEVGCGSPKNCVYWEYE